MSIQGLVQNRYVTGSACTIVVPVFINGSDNSVVVPVYYFLNCFGLNVVVGCLLSCGLSINRPPTTQQTTHNSFLLF